MCQELAAKTEGVSVDEAKLGLIWKASLGRFADWETGKGDLSSIKAELEQLTKITSDEVALPSICNICNCAVSQT